MTAGAASAYRPHADAPVLLGTLPIPLRLDQISLRHLRLLILCVLLVIPGLAGLRTPFAGISRHVLFTCAAAYLYVWVVEVALRIQFPHYSRRVWMTFAALAALIGWGIYRASGITDGSQIILLLGLGVLWLGVVDLRVNGHELLWVGAVGSIVGFTSVLVALISPGLYLHPNYIGGLLSAYLFFPLILGLAYRRTLLSVVPVLIAFAFVVAVAAAGSRASLLAMLAAISVLVLVWIVRPSARARRARAVGALVFIGIMSVVAFIILTGGNVFDNAIGERLGRLSETLFNKPITSGRHRLWPALVDVLRDKLWIGFGTGASTRSALDVTLSAHNLYLEVWLQWGMVGVVLMLSTFAFLGRVLWRQASDVGFLTLAFLLALMVRDLFEVTLIQNNAPLALGFWLIVGLGAGFLEGKALSRGVNRYATHGGERYPLS